MSPSEYTHSTTQRNYLIHLFLKVYGPWYDVLGHIVSLPSSTIATFKEQVMASRKTETVKMNFMDELMARPPISYDTSPTKKQKLKKTFTDLPHDTRVRIYQFLFTPKPTSKRHPENCSGGIDIFARGPRSCDSFDISILTVSRAIYVEALPILWQNTSFLLQMDFRKPALLAYQGSALASNLAMRNHVRNITISMRLGDLLDEDVQNAKFRNHYKNDLRTAAKYYRAEAFVDPFLARACYAIATELQFVEEVTLHIDIESGREEARLWELQAYTRLQQIVYHLNNVNIILEFHFHIDNNFFQNASSFYLGTARKWETASTQWLRGLAWRYEHDLRCPKNLKFVARSVFSDVPKLKPAAFFSSEPGLVRPKDFPDWRPRSGSYEEKLLRKAEALERKGGYIHGDEGVVKDDASGNSDSCTVGAE